MYCYSRPLCCSAIPESDVSLCTMTNTSFGIGDCIKWVCRGRDRLGSTIVLWHSRLTDFRSLWWCFLTPYFYTFLATKFSSCWTRYDRTTTAILWGICLEKLASFIVDSLYSRGCNFKGIWHIKACVHRYGIQGSIHRLMLSTYHNTPCASCYGKLFFAVNLTASFDCYSILFLCYVLLAPDGAYVPTAFGFLSFVNATLRRWQFSLSLPSLAHRDAFSTFYVLWLIVSDHYNITTSDWVSVQLISMNLILGCNAKQRRSGLQYFWQCALLTSSCYPLNGT